MYNGGQLIHEENAKLSFDFFLQEVAHERDRIEGRRDFERFERVVPEHQGDTFLFRKDQDHEAGQFKIGQGNLQRNGEGSSKDIQQDESARSPMQPCDLSERLTQQPAVTATRTMGALEDRYSADLPGLWSSGSERHRLYMTS